MRLQLRRFTRLLLGLVVVSLLMYTTHWYRSVKLSVNFGLTVDERNNFQSPDLKVQTHKNMSSTSQYVTTIPMQPSKLSTVATTNLQRTSKFSTAAGTDSQHTSKLSTATTTNLQHASKNSTAANPDRQRTSKVSTVASSNPQHAHQCKDLVCSEYLPEGGAKRGWQSCAGRRVLAQPPSVKCSCHFQNGTGKRLVALISLPGSGNTWVRGLLEEATGICTGSIYCDSALAGGGFCGEGYYSREALAIKTHNLELFWAGINETVGTSSNDLFDAAILVIRDPHTGAIAEYNRRNGKAAGSKRGARNDHVRFVDDPHIYGSNAKWNEYVSLYLIDWIKMIRSNVISSMKELGRPVLVVYYEDLKKNEASEVKRMLDFLEVPYSTERERKPHQSFYRNHTDTFEHFTASQKDHYNREITKFSEELQRHQLLDVSKRMLNYVYSTPV